MSDQQQEQTPGVKFGISQVTNRTPLWAKWVFRVTILLTTAVAFWVGGTQLIAEAWKFEIILILKVIDPVVLGISKLFGVEGEVSPELVQSRLAARESLKESQQKDGE